MSTILTTATSGSDATNGLPLGIGHIRTRTHGYIRHGTITLFAALSYLDGKIINRLAERSRIDERLERRPGLPPSIGRINRSLRVVQFARV